MTWLGSNNKNGTARRKPNVTRFLNDAAAVYVYSVAIECKYFVLSLKLGEGTNLSLPRGVQTSSVAHPAFCSAGIGFSLPGG